MKKMEKNEKTIPLYIESKRGHDTINVPNTPTAIQNAVESQLKDGKWVTTEKADGSSEILTASDIPKDIPIDEKPLMEMADTPKDELADLDLDEDSDDDEEDDDKEVSASANPTEWKQAFKEEKKGTTPTPTKKATKPTTPREEWESKFTAVKSATATNKSKGG